MRPRLSVRARLSGSRFLLRLEGELDGSTACLVLSAMARAPRQAREVVVDLAGVTSLERFGLDVLARGAPSSARGRAVRLTGAPAANGEERGVSSARDPMEAHAVRGTGAKGQRRVSLPSPDRWTIP